MTMSAHGLLRWTAVSCALFALSAPAASAQTVFPVQGLAFGQLQPGVAATIQPTDAARRAEYSVTGSGTFVLTMALPPRLTSAAGHQIPMNYATNAGRVRWRTFGIQFTFNPNNPYTLWLPFFAGGGTVYVGGTASPAASQAPGVYTATMTLMIANAGT
jgi:hypothetical protein